MEAGAVAIVHDERELYDRTRHLFAAATQMYCAANDTNTFAAYAKQRRGVPSRPSLRKRKLFRPGVLLDKVAATQLHGHTRQPDITIRITPDDVNETIIIDRKVAILAGEVDGGRRSYSVISQPEVVQGVTSLFDAAWRNATDFDVYNARIADLRQIAPQVLDLLASGCKDETAARALDLSVRTYRRRVAELMTALGADSRFQAGVRARELGLV